MPRSPARRLLIDFVAWTMHTSRECGYDDGEYVEKGVIDNVTRDFLKDIAVALLQN